MVSVLIFEPVFFSNLIFMAPGCFTRANLTIYFSSLFEDTGGRLEIVLGNF
jgi:hypothetical protein